MLMQHVSLKYCHKMFIISQQTDKALCLQITQIKMFMMKDFVNKKYDICIF